MGKLKLMKVILKTYRFRLYFDQIHVIENESILEIKFLLRIL